MNYPADIYENIRMKGIEQGRNLMAHEVIAWINRIADPATGMAHTETLRALMQKELAK